MLLPTSKTMNFVPWSPLPAIVATSVRNLSYLLHPPLLDETGLRAALHWYIDGMVKRSGIQIALNVTPQAFPRISKDIETTIFRIVQEALTNVYRHAATESARVDIEKQPDWVIVRVRDTERDFRASWPIETVRAVLALALAGCANGFDNLEVS